MKTTTTTTTTQHTPGPWIESEWRTDSNGEYKEVGALHGRVWVADVRADVEPGNGSANARLIAAAPDLLAACEAAVSKVELDWPIALSWATNMKAAIAKAK